MTPEIKRFNSFDQIQGPTSVGQLEPWMRNGLEENKQTFKQQVKQAIKPIISLVAGAALITSTTIACADKPTTNPNQSTQPSGFGNTQPAKTPDNAASYQFPRASQELQNRIEQNSKRGPLEDLVKSTPSTVVRLNSERFLNLNEAQLSPLLYPAVLILEHQKASEIGIQTIPVNKTGQTYDFFGTQINLRQNPTFLFRPLDIVEGEYQDDITKFGIPYDQTLTNLAIIHRLQ